jgi:flagellin
MGSISINVVNLQFVLSIGASSDGGNGSFTASDLGGLNNDSTESGINTSGFISDILNVNVSQFTEAIERLADMRAENGAEQNRVMNTLDLLQTNITNLEAAHGRIMDADIALESTRFARHNVLVQASAAMTAQANQLTNVALQLLG